VLDSGVGWVDAFPTQHLPRNVLGCEKMQPNLHNYATNQEKNMFRNKVVIMQLPQFDQKILLIAIAFMLSSPAYAMSDLVPVINNMVEALVKGLAMLIGFYLFPAVFGLLIVKKDRRSWFVSVLVALYVATLLFLVVGVGLLGVHDLTLLGLPYLLIPVAIYSRLQKTRSE
jgi:uncharacterized membrane-anchored protein